MHGEVRFGEEDDAGDAVRGVDTVRSATPCRAVCLCTRRVIGEAVEELADRSSSPASATASRQTSSQCAAVSVIAASRGCAAVVQVGGEVKPLHGRDYPAPLGGAVTVKGPS